MELRSFAWHLFISTHFRDTSLVIMCCILQVTLLMQCQPGMVTVCVSTNIMTASYGHGLRNGD